MSLLADYRLLVDEKITETINSQDWLPTKDVLGLYAEFLSPAKALLSSGKRTRAAFTAAGWQLFHPLNSSKIHHDLNLPVIAGSAIELYQGSALIHDDIIDSALLRRNQPATHIAFQNTHKDLRLIGNNSKFGLNSAILLGDFLLSLSTFAFQKAEHLNQEALKFGTTIFHAMTTEVAFGQYLDNRREFTPLSDEYDEEISQAYKVLYHKSARYSVDCPLKIGAALAGASSAQVAALSEIGRPLGEAFQLRDDHLGVFGAEKITGKPTGGDLREGKRTVLVGLTRKLASPADRKILDSALGQALSAAEITQLQEIIINCGALAVHEEMINTREQQAQIAIAKLTGNTALLNELAQMLISRQS